MNQARVFERTTGICVNELQLGSIGRERRLCLGVGTYVATAAPASDPRNQYEVLHSGRANCETLEKPRSVHVSHQILHVFYLDCETRKYHRQTSSTLV